MRRPAALTARVLPGLAAVIVLAFAAACGGDGPTAPAAEPALVSDVTVDGTVGGGGEGRWRYVAAPDEAIEIRFTPLGYGLALHRVRDDGTLAVIVPATVQQDTTTRRIRLVASPRGETIRLAVAPRSGADGGAFRLAVAGQNRAPESRAAAIALDEMVEERMDGRRDADVYTLSLAAPTGVLMMAAMVDGGGATVPVSARLRPVRDSAGPGWEVLATTAVRAGVALETSATSVVTLAAGRYQLVVERDPYLEPAPADARYRVQLRRVDIGPEERTGDLALGDTIASTIDYVGDVDDWTVRGTPGDSVVAFVQATGGTAAVRLRHEGPLGTDTTVVARAGQALVAASSGRLRIPESGMLRLRVEGSDGVARTSGPYRLFTYRPDTMPEVPQARPAALGETIEGRIELPGDVDVFAVTVPAPTLANLVLERGAGASGGPAVAQLRITASPGGTPEAQVGTEAARGGSGTLLLVAGTHRLRVSGLSARGTGFMGPYRLLLAPVDSTAESRPAAVAVGDTVRGEAIAPLGDVDTFTLAGTAGDTITIMLAGEVAEARVPLRGTLLDSLGREVQTTLGSTGTPGRAGPETGRLQLPYTGTYRVRVHGETSGRDGSEAMPYRLVVERVSMRPEGGPAILALGVTRRERLDLRGDLDEFELRAPPHAEVKVQFDDLTGISTGSLRAMVRMLDGQTGAELSVHYTAPWIGQRTAMFMRMPPSGHIRVRVFEMGALGCMEACRLFGLTGDFDILATQMDQAVEGHSGTLAIGEMATGNLATADDIDSYTFEATAGTQLWFRFRHVSGPGVMVAMLRDAETGADVSGFLSRTPMATASQWPVNITRTGRYTVWVGPEVPGGFIAPIGGSGAERGNYEVGVLRR